jgi:hypothetical protein
VHAQYYVSLLTLLPVTEETIITTHCVAPFFRYEKYDDKKDYDSYSKDEQYAKEKYVAKDKYSKDKYSKDKYSKDEK